MCVLEVMEVVGVGVGEVGEKEGGYERHTYLRHTLHRWGCV